MEKDSKMTILSGYFTQESDIPELCVVVKGIDPGELKKLIDSRDEDHDEDHNDDYLNPEKLIAFIKDKGYEVLDIPYYAMYDVHNGASIRPTISKLAQIKG